VPVPAGVLTGPAVVMSNSVLGSRIRSIASFMGTYRRARPDSSRRRDFFVGTGYACQWQGADGRLEGFVTLSVSEDFSHRTDLYRPELLAHCYRMLGSVHDAEDLVQETLLRAWRAYDRFDDSRASLRTWLHRIATNACLNALEGRNRRPLPSGLGAPLEDPMAPMVPGREVPWLQPFPDAVLRSEGTDPAVALMSRETLRLAFVAAMQFLPARQRAILILREVLQWSAAEVGEALEISTAAVNSGLQRARAKLAEQGIREEELSEPSEADRRAVVEQYVAAFEAADVARLERLLTDDAVLEMPPVLNWYVGSDKYAGFMTRVFQMRGKDWRVLPISANGQPALAAYARAEDGVYHMHTLQVLTLAGDRVAHNVVFMMPELFPLFGLPETIAG